MARIVIGVLLLSSIASADPAERLNGLKWQGTIDFIRDIPFKTETQTGKSCGIGEKCSQTDTSTSSERTEAKIVVKGGDATARIEFSSHLGTKTEKTFTEKCYAQATGPRMNPTIPTKSGTILETSSLDGKGDVTMPVNVSVVVEGSKYRVSFRLPPAKGSMKRGSTRKATGGCSDRNKPEEPPVTTELYSLNYSTDHYAPLPKLPADLRELKLTGTGKMGGGTFTYSLSPTGDDSELVAEAGEPQIVDRGEQATLDGSGAKGKIKSYQWEVLSASCLKAQEVKALKKPTQKVLTFTPLCEVTMQLTVSDGKNTATDTTKVEVVHRDGDAWKTPAVPATTLTWDWAPEAKGEWAMPHTVDEGAGVRYVPKKAKWGENVCLKERKHALWGITHPHPTAASENPDTWTWKGAGYEVATVRDNGPFNGWAYVKSTDIVVEREAIFNAYADTDSLAPPGAPMNYAKANELIEYKDPTSGAKISVKAYEAWRKALELHEGEGDPNLKDSGHTRQIRDKLAEEGMDPRKALEPLVAKSATELHKKVDDELRRINIVLSRASKRADGEDRDQQMSGKPILWKGPFRYWNATRKVYDIDPNQDM